ncbi:DUF2490 domain-containing protein [Galbibacter orientalis]|uniref:DUF2490 domain-containing protein n=1 Tax=Galbibacter orientalis TaxID=453852 RepID=UPI003001D200
MQFSKMNLFFKTIIITLLFITSTNTLSSQERGRDQLGSWFAFNGTNMISEKFSWHTEAQFRYYEFAHNFNQTLLRTAINYHFSNKAMVSAGYGYIDTSSYDKNENQITSAENRIYEQFILRNNLGKFNFLHRYRLEQRWVNSLGYTELLHRFRYYLEISYPITENWHLVVSDEIMINFEPDLFNQNRLFGGIRYKFSKDLAFQLGYLKNHFSDISFDRISLTVAFRTDFIAKALQK